MTRKWGLKPKRRNSNFDARNPRGYIRLQCLALSLFAVFILFYFLTFFDSFDQSPLFSNFDTQTPTRPRRGPATRSGTEFPPSLHVYRDDGLLEVNYNGSHPILELMDYAEETWKNKHARASRTLQEAITEYERRYHRLPPKGFDDWWNYVVEHNVKLPDEYDSIYNDLEPYWGISPADLQKIQDYWFDRKYEIVAIIGKEDGMPLRILNNSMSEDRMLVHENRIMQLIKLLKDVDHLLPDFQVVIDASDNPSSVARWEAKESLLRAAKAGTYANVDEGASLRPNTIGWPVACSPDSPASRTSLDLNDPYFAEYVPRKSKTFIYDHRRSMDPCLHPTHFLQSGQFLRHKHTPPIEDYAVLQLASCSTSLHYDALAIPPDSVIDDDPRPWTEKHDERLLWRGSNTGIRSTSESYWRHTQRPRLVRQTASMDGYIDILRSPSSKEENGVIGEPERWRSALVNPAMMDVKFAGDPIQCQGATCKELKESFEWRPFMSRADASNYKYIIDVDGNGWSSRFRRLMTSNSVIFKSTVYPEWFSDRIQPWYHYVPISVDYSDLYDALVFFRGDLKGYGSHDHLARRIAEAGRHWTQVYARPEDMTAYMFRLVLEYARLMSPDRDAMTMSREAL